MGEHYPFFLVFLPNFRLRGILLGNFLWRYIPPPAAIMGVSPFIFRVGWFFAADPFLVGLLLQRILLSNPISGLLP